MKKLASMWKLIVRKKKPRVSTVPENRQFQHPNVFQISLTSLSLRTPSLEEDRCLSQMQGFLDWALTFQCLMQAQAVSKENIFLTKR